MTTKLKSSRRSMLACCTGQIAFLVFHLVGPSMPAPPSFHPLTLIHCCIEITSVMVCCSTTTDPNLFCGLPTGLGDIWCMTKCKVPMFWNVWGFTLPDQLFWLVRFSNSILVINKNCQPIGEPDYTRGLRLWPDKPARTGFLLILLCLPAWSCCRCCVANQISTRLSRVLKNTPKSKSISFYSKELNRISSIICIWLIPPNKRRQKIHDISNDIVFVVQGKACNSATVQ